MSPITYPTPLHQSATEVITGFFLQQKNIDTVLLVNSLARGKGSPESDIDMAVLVTQSTNPTEASELDQYWQDFSVAHPVLKEYSHSSKFAHLHVDVIDGVFEPPIWEAGVGVDFFEVEIGNRLLYSAPLTPEGDYFKQLKKQWLPYYDSVLQGERLQLSKAACRYELEHIPIFVSRGLYFQAFDRLYVALQKFLQALFIQHQTYPIAYNKWIKDQIVGILNLPELYQVLPNIISIHNFESQEIIEKAKLLEALLAEYCA